MPATINGCGTRFYGETAFRPDGSFITTEWIVLLWLPLIPFRSFRAVRNSAEDINAHVFIAEGYQVVERIGLYWPQVVRTYLFTAGILGWWCFVIWLISITLNMKEPNHWLYAAGLIAVFGPLPFFILGPGAEEILQCRNPDRDHEPAPD